VGTLKITRGSATRDFFRCPTRENNFFRLSSYCTVIPHYCFFSETRFREFVSNVRLQDCLKKFFDDKQNDVHDAIEDTKDCKRIAEEAASRRDYKDVLDMLDKNKKYLLPLMLD
jgi:hypothetical protein